MGGDAQHIALWVFQMPKGVENVDSFSGLLVILIYRLLQPSSLVIKTQSRLHFHASHC
jgi:hypothetical protein